MFDDHGRDHVLDVVALTAAPRMLADDDSHGETCSPLSLAGWPPQMVDQFTAMLSEGRLVPFAAAADRVGYCARPVRLRGSSTKIDTITGEVLAEFSSTTSPLGVTYVRCGNRRELACPSCSRLYAADVFQMIKAGVCGGKTVPETVADNPLVFATLTAPSFGRVHSAQSCGKPHLSRKRCPHGIPIRCPIKHADDADELGQPVCPDCYDYRSQVIWQWWAPTLWKRFTIRLRRLVAHELGVPGYRLGELATVQYAKVAEFQIRGVIHFHALVRLDGLRTREGFAPAPSQLDRGQLAGLVQTAVTEATMTAPGVDPGDPGRVLMFGRQVEVRPVKIGRRTDDPTAPLIPEQVAGYLAKYSTKSAADTGPVDSPHRRRIHSTIADLAFRAECAELTGTLPEDARSYLRLKKWTHMLGFRGHFASKSRRYAITLGALRRARRRFQALMAETTGSRRPLNLADLEQQLLTDPDDDTTLVVGRWAYDGSGWANDAETALAIAAAARAREYVQQRAQRKSPVQ